MFSPNSLDKNCVGSDNCSSGRNNATRFPVGMTSLGDENQQIRIQLAVHKYNSSGNSQLNNRTSGISPIRHSFLKSSLKAKNFEGDPERSSKSERKNGNKYEGVGAFPTIHLKKSAVRYRPIKRFNDVKIPYPELPVSRFLSHLPEVNSDLKSNGRSVLDVLEDLSGKKIHSNEENKPKLKGLGGDYLPNPNAVYKPLFVQKPKTGSILTRDNTTQTLTPSEAEISSPQSCNSLARNDVLDPKAELRKKLAKQNNEIFASLSSSISSSFALKRKLDKILPGKDIDQMTEGTMSKKSKISNHQYKNHNDNGDSRTAVKSKVKSTESLKLNRKSKISEANSPTSPNKDRLTTIFLDMRNTSPKTQIFENNSTSTEASTKQPIENGLKEQNNLSNGFEISPNTFGVESKNPAVDDHSRTSTTESDLKNSSVVDLTEKVDSPNSKNIESEQRSQPMFNFPVNKPNSPQNEVKSTPSEFQFDANTSNFTFQKTVKNGFTSSEVTANAGSTESKAKALNKSLTSENTKPDFSSFKFGAEENVPVVSKDPEPPKSQISEALPVSKTTSSSMTPQFSFGTTAIVTMAASVPSSVGFGVTGTQNTMTVPAKPLFTFGQNQQTAKDEEKIKTPVTISNATTIQSDAFSFGQKLNAESPANSHQNAPSSTVPTSQSSITNSSPAATTSTNSATAIHEKNLFAFGQNAKSETPTTSTTVSTNQEQKFAFSFGQKTDAGQSKPLEGFEQKDSMFFCGQKSTSQELSQTTSVVTNVTSPSQLPSTQSTSLFGQNLPQVTSTSQVTFKQSPAAQPTNDFGAKSEVETVTAPSTSQNSTDFPSKTPLFAPSGSGFGNATTQASTGFETTTSSASGFKFGASTTTQSTPAFGVSSAPQTAPTFGASSTSQPISGFVSSSTTQSTGAFGVPTSNSTPTFGISRQASFTFGISSTTQTAPTFGSTSTTQSTPAFGTSSASQSTPSFGIPSTAQSTSGFGAPSTSLTTSGFGATSTTQTPSAFGGSPSFGVPSSQPNAAFGAPTSSQSALQFGAPAVQDNTTFGTAASFSAASSTLPNNSFGASTATSTSGFGTSPSSFSQPFGSKPPVTSLGQTSNIFGQSPAPSFSSNTVFNSNQSNVFGPKPNPGGNMFDQNKIQTPGFGATTQPFGTQNKFSFGMSTSNATGFTTSPPNTTAAPVFSFGANSTGNTFTFGSNASGSGNTQTPFAFKSLTNEPFKFGASTTKEGSGFGGTNTSTFTFSGQINNNPIAEQKPAFNFGSTQVSSSSPFNFGTTPSPSVFSFGGSTSAGSGSSFNFGTPTPSGPFGQAASMSRGAPFSVPGTFSIGSGSSQSRPRATSRPRRRP